MWKVIKNKKTKGKTSSRNTKGAKRWGKNTEKEGIWDRRFTARRDTEHLKGVEEKVG